MKNPQDYKNPAATATFIFEKQGKILLVKRKHEPYKGKWCLPGGFLNYGKETLEKTAQREAYEETSLKVRQKDLYLLCVNSSPNRDPRGHVIDHVYIATEYSGKFKAGDDASELLWKDLNKIPRLAFDHNKDIKKYKEWKREKCQRKY